jgi:hypothetical protein
MQSYAQIVDPRLTYRDLPRLGCVLKLPAGWSYSTKTLTHTLELNSNGLLEGWRYRTRTPDRDLTLRTVAGAAHVPQDELQNTYMRLMTV